MTITEKQALDYISGMVLSMRAKIEIFDDMLSDSTGQVGNATIFDGNDDYIHITQDERILCGSLEILLAKAKVNSYFVERKKNE